MKRLAFIAVAIVLLTGCASFETYPYRTCLYSRVGGREYTQSGTVLDRDGDGRRLFRYDDQTQGDHGYRWIADGELTLRPCITHDALTATQPESR